MIYLMNDHIYGFADYPIGTIIYRMNNVTNYFVAYSMSYDLND